MNKDLLAEARKTRLAFLLIVMLSLLGGVLILIQAWQSSYVIKRVFHDNAALSDLWGAFAILAGLVILRLIAAGAGQYAAGTVAVCVKDDLRRRFSEHLLKLGPAYAGANRTGELVNTATNGVDALDAYFRDYLPGLFTALLIPLAILAVVLPLDRLTFAVLLLTAPLIPFFMALIGMSAGGFARQQYDAMNALSAHFLDVLQGLIPLKLLNRSRQQITTIERITDRYRQTTMDVLRLAFLSSLALELLATLSIALVAVEIGIRLINGGIPFQQALFLLVIAPEFYLPLRALGTKFHASTSSAAAADHIFDVLAEPLPDSGGSQSVPDTLTLTVDRVRFAYSPDDAPVLDDCSFTLHHGEQLALIGSSGSGKTTLTRLLLRFLDVSNGAITVDGVPLNTLDRGAWQSQIAWVPQSPYLLNDTVWANIRLGMPTASDDAVIRAAKQADAHDFITTLPAGYNTRLGEDGSRLSGGQRQRIAIARAFLKDAPLLILDEVTANLDPVTEERVLVAMQRLAAGRTVLMVAHRLNTITHVDRIAVMANGRIAEIGTHDQLLAQSGMYAAMHQTYERALAMGGIA